MKAILVLTAAAVAAATLTATASPAPSHQARQALRWHDLSLAQKRTVVVREIRRERQPLRWWLRTGKRLPESSAAPLTYCASVGVRIPGPICIHASRLVGALHVLARIDSRLAAKAAAEARARALAALPAHHALWMCIHGDPAYRHGGGGEAGSWDNADTGGNGHYGGLQMHPYWGYGTSKYASNDSQAVQERAAESGYAASGYSRVWLNGQWGQTMGPCWGYA